MQQKEQSKEGQYMIRVKNKTNDVRKFRDTFTGKDILVEPKASVFTNMPIQSSDIWAVETEKEMKAIKKKEGVKL